LINSGNGSALNVLPSLFTVPFSVSISAIELSFAASTASGQTKICNPIFIAFLKD
jgi:hypothetical protein